MNSGEKEELDGEKGEKQLVDDKRIDGFGQVSVWTR
jgi:hypothetical protein